MNCMNYSIYSYVNQLFILCWRAKHHLFDKIAFLDQIKSVKMKVKIERCEMMKINEWLAKADEVIQDKTIREMFKKCFMSTLETSIRITNGRTYIITGDINAMWLRDSSCQVQPYLYLLKENEELQSLIKGLIRTQIDYAMWDPYANAFLDQEDVPREYRDTTMMKPYVWERKFELDSLCYPVRLAYEYYCQTDDETIFDDVFLRFIHTLLNVFETEQYPQLPQCVGRNESAVLRPLCGK